MKTNVSLSRTDVFSTIYIIFHWLIIAALIFAAKLDASTATLVIFAGGLALSVFLGLLHFYWLYLVYVVYLAFQGAVVIDNQSVYIHPHTIFEIFLLLSWFASRALRLVERYRPSILDGLVGLLLLLTVSSIIWSSSLWVSITFSIKFILTLGGCFYATTVAVKDRIMLRRLTNITMIIAVLNSILCYLFILTYPDFKSIDIGPDVLDWGRFHLLLNDVEMGKRGHGIAHPIYTSIWISFGIHVAFYKMLFTSSVFKKLAYALLILFFLSAIQTSLSKGPVLALFVSFTAHVLLTPNLRGWLLTIASLFLCGILMGFIIGNSADLSQSWEVTQHQFSPSEEYSSTESRLRWWVQSTKASLETAGLGCGAGNAVSHLDPKGPHPHSAYVAVFSELGFTGLLLFLSIIAWGTVLGLSAIRSFEDQANTPLQVMIFCWFVNVVFNIVTIGSFQEPLLWYTLALNLAVTRIAQESNRDKKQLSAEYSSPIPIRISNRLKAM